MSSFLGHALIGMAIGAPGTTANRGQRAAILGLVAGLAMSPDVDYFGIWLFGSGFQSRYTHSIAFCLGASLLGIGLYRLITRTRLTWPAVAALVLAPISHLVLDYLVGVHKSPFLWPFLGTEMCSPIGVLPSAGRLDLANLYFWRNLVIEMAILVPVAVYIRRKGKISGTSAIANLLLLGLLCAGIAISVSLSR